MTNMATSERHKFTIRSHRGFIFLTLKLVPNRSEEPLKINVNDEEITITSLQKFPVLRLIAPHAFEIYQLGVSYTTYAYEGIQKICHKSCASCIGRRVVDCMSCYNDTNLTMVSTDTGKCVYEKDDDSIKDYGLGLGDFLHDNLGWIVMVGFVLVCSVIIYITWYTCCKACQEESQSPAGMKIDGPPHLELYEEKAH